MNNSTYVDQKNEYNIRSEPNIDIIALHKKRMNEMEEEDITVELAPRIKSKEYFDIEAYKCKNVFKSGEIPLSSSIPKEVESSDDGPLYIEQPNSLLDEILKATSEKKKKRLKTHKHKHLRYDDRPYIPSNRYGDENPKKFYLRNQNRHNYDDNNYNRTSNDSNRYFKVKSRRNHDQERNNRRPKNDFYYERYSEQDLNNFIDEPQKSSTILDNICTRDDIKDGSFLVIRGYRREKDNQFIPFENSKELYDNTKDMVVEDEIFITDILKNDNNVTTKSHDKMNHLCFDKTDFENSKDIIRETMKDEDICDNFHEDDVFEDEVNENVLKNFNSQNEKMTSELQESINKDQRGEANIKDAILLNYPCISILKELSISIDKIMLFPEDVKQLILSSTSKEGILEILGGQT